LLIQGASPDSPTNDFPVGFGNDYSAYIKPLLRERLFLCGIVNGTGSTDILLADVEMIFEIISTIRSSGGMCFAGIGEIAGINHCALFIQGTYLIIGSRRESPVENRSQ
jgi:hypothetical protein